MSATIIVLMCSSDSQMESLSLARRRSLEVIHRSRLGSPIFRVVGIDILLSISQALLAAEWTEGNEYRACLLAQRICLAAYLLRRMR